MKPIELRPDLPLEIEEKVLAPQQVIYVRLVGAYVNLDYCAAWQRLWNHVREENLFAPEIGHLCIYHDDPKVTEPDKLRTDVCLALPRVGKPKGEVGVKEVAGGKYAIFRYRGPYSNLHAVYDTIYLKWIPERGYKLGNTPGFEKYLNHPDHVKPEDLGCVDEFGAADICQCQLFFSSFSMLNRTTIRNMIFFMVPFFS